MNIHEAKTKSQRVRLALIMSLPAIAEYLLMTLVNLIDTAMVGALGANATTAVALVTSPVWVVNSLTQAINVGCSVLVAHYIGAGDMKSANAGARETFVLGLSFGILSFAVMWSLAPYLPVWMRGDPEVCPDSTAYLRICSLGFPLYYMGLILNGAVRGNGDTYTPMKITACANILNLFANYFLIYEPRVKSIFGREIYIWGAGMGVNGAAAATAFSTAFSGLIVLCILLFTKNEFRINVKDGFKLKIKDLKQIFAVGFPTAVERVTINLGQVFFIRIVSSLGTIMLAAHHIAVSAESVCYQPGYGLQAAGTALTGQALGTGDEEMADEYAKIVVWLSIAVMTVNAALMFIFAHPFISLFTPDKDVIANATVALRIIAFAQPFFAVYIVGTGVLRGLGDVKIAMPVSLICMWFLRIPLAFLAVKVFKLGLSGAWYVMLFDLFLRGVYFMYRLYSGKWRKIYHGVFKDV